MPAYANHLKNYGHPSEVGYKDVLKDWNPKRLNPAELVKLYHDAGARFLFVQGVHHDNFDLWNSRYQPWNSVNLSPHRDLLGEWSSAAKRLGMRYGVAFHHEYTWWWYQSAFGSDQTGPKAGVPYDGHLTKADGKGQWWDGLDPRMLYTVNLLEYANINNGRIGIAASEGIFGRHLDYAKWYATWWALRIMDVIDQYDPDFIYTDGNSTQPFSGDKSGSGFKCDAASRVVAHFYNHTLAKRGKVDTFSIIKFHPPCNGIVSTEEGTYPKAVKTDQPWIGENAVGDWFYSPGFTYDAGSVIRCLLEYVSRDGSYAVCVSQQPDGSLDEGSRDMLKGIGDWLRVNGEAIYGSKAWVTFGEGRDDVGNIKTLPEGKLGSKQADFPFGADDIRFTVGKDGSLYAIAMAVPKGEVRVKSLGSDSKLLDKKITSVALLGSNTKLDWKQEPDALVIQPVAKWPCQHAVAFKIAMGEKMK
jgi:alpha-L-fucosidase